MVSGQFRRSQTLRFTVTFQTHPIPCLNSLCNPNFDLPNHPQNFLFLGPQNQMYASEKNKNVFFSRERVKKTDVPSNASYFPAYVGTSVFFTPSLGKNIFGFFRSVRLYVCACLPGPRAARARSRLHSQLLIAPTIKCHGY